MTLEFETRGGMQVAKLPVRLGLVNASRVRRSLESQLASASPFLVVDLSGVEFVDSSGLAALLAAIKAARRQGGDVALAGPRPRVRALIELTRLDDVVPIAATTDEALERLTRVHEAA